MLNAKILKGVKETGKEVGGVIAAAGVGAPAKVRKTFSWKIRKSSHVC
jgi:hypothetical protein